MYETCPACQQQILPQLDKSLRISGKKYHLKCFVCSQCGVDFPHKRFFMKDHMLFCEKDYAKRFCSLCISCGEPVISGGLATALGAFHAEHFNCHECGTNLPNTKFAIFDKKAYCLKHKPKGTSNINCSHCGEIVDPRMGRRARHKWYHKGCFKCSHCSVPLNMKTNDVVFVHDEKLYCEEDFNLYHMKRCTKCCLRIIGKSFEANDEYYHPDCLKCEICEKKLEKYRTWGGLLRCAEHASTEVELICDMCEEEIPTPSEAVAASGMLLHKSCFRCHSCSSPLTKTSHRIDPLKGPICLPCLEKSVKTDTRDTGASSGGPRASTPGSLPASVIQSSDLKYIHSPSKNFRPRPLSPVVSPPQTPTRSPRVPFRQNLSTTPRKASERLPRSSPPPPKTRTPMVPNRRTRPAANTVGGVGELANVFNLFKQDQPKTAAQCISDILADSARSSLSNSSGAAPLGRSIMGSGVRTRGKVGSGTASAGGSPRQSLSYREMQKSRRTAAQSTGGELAARTAELLSDKPDTGSPRTLRAQITKNRRSRSVSSADPNESQRTNPPKRSPFGRHSRNNQTYPRAPDPHSKALPDPPLCRGALASSPKSLSTGLLHSPHSTGGQLRPKSTRKPFFKKNVKQSPTSEPRNSAANVLHGSSSERSVFRQKETRPSTDRKRPQHTTSESSSASSMAQDFLNSMIKRQTAESRSASFSVADLGSSSKRSSPYPTAHAGTTAVSTAKPTFHIETVGGGASPRTPSAATAPKVGVLDTEDDDLTATRRRVGAVLETRKKRFYTESDVHGDIPNGGENGSNTLGAASPRHVRFTSRENLSPINSDALTVSVTDTNTKKEATDGGLSSPATSPRAALLDARAPPSPSITSTSTLSPKSVAKSAPSALTTPRSVLGTSPEQQALHSLLSGGNVDFDNPQYQTPVPQTTYTNSLSPSSSSSSHNTSRSMSMGPPVTGNPGAVGGLLAGGGGGHRKRPSQADIQDYVRQRSDNMDWRKGKVLGKGAFGVVYKGMITGTGEIVAVKQLTLDSEEDLTAAAQIESEIEILTMLDHPNIVKVKGTQRRENKLNIIMEFVPGNSISHIMGEYGALAEDTIRIYVYQILNALAYMHSQNVLHRDIKAKNILADTMGNCKLADFGSATVFEDMSVARQPSLNYNYTPLWTAPEVVHGAYGRKVDIWGLGCVIIEMATAKTPWHEKASTERQFRNPFRILYYIGNSGEIPEIPTNLSTAGQDFVRKCLERDPDKRQDAQELLKHRWVEMCDVPGDELDYENGPVPDGVGVGPSNAVLEAVGTPQQGSHNRTRSIMNHDHIVRSTTPSFAKHRIPTPLHLE